MTDAKKLADSLSAALKARNAWLVLLASFAFLLSIYVVSANIFSPSLFSLNPLAQPLPALLMVLLALGGSLLITVAYASSRIASSAGGMGTAGGIVGLLASACPVCPPFLAFFLGAQAFYGLSSFGMVFSLLAVVLVYWGLYGMLASSSTCPVQLNGHANGGMNS